MDDRLSTRDLLDRYRAGERAFRELEIDDAPGEAPLRGSHLDDLDVTGSFLVVDFSGARLRNAILRANVKTCIFDGADLTGADFRGAAIDAATFRDAILTGARFEGASEQGHRYGPEELPYQG